MLQPQGILYITTGKKYIRDALRSAQSARQISPELPIHLFADYQNYDFNFDDSPHPFSSLGQIDQPHRRSKVEYLAQTPFERTLYLDSDTRLNADVSGIFALLERFDIALAHAHWRNHPITSLQWKDNIPVAFPQFNSGVMLYQRTPAILQLFHEWQVGFNEAGFAQDQVTLRELLWQSDLRIATLPPEYNVRFIKYHYLWSKAEAETKIFHLQKYHDGPFWFVKSYGKQVGRALMRLLHINLPKKKEMGK